MLDVLGTELIEFEALSITPVTLILVAVLAALLLSFASSLKSARAEYMRNLFRETYHVVLDRDTLVKRRSPSAPNCFRLEFPFWTHPNRDGSCNKRWNHNPINYGTCQLDIGEFSVFLVSPIHLVWLVNTLRSKGASIPMCPEEHAKRMEVEKRAKLLATEASLASIVGTFQETPTDFEEYCAALFRSEGYKADTTPRTRDGGYDIEMISPDGKSSIVECKCYDPANKVGRDTVQKLVGANALRHADRMLFVTTSDFTPEAREYARNVGVELINGERLLDIARGRNRGTELSEEVSNSSWRLTWDDLKQYYPPDFPPPRIEV